MKQPCLECVFSKNGIFFGSQYLNIIILGKILIDLPEMLCQHPADAILKFKEHGAPLAQ